MLTFLAERKSYL